MNAPNADRAERIAFNVLEQVRTSPAERSLGLAGMVDELAQALILLAVEIRSQARIAERIADDRFGNTP